MKRLTIVACALVAAGCVGPLWPKKTPDFAAEYRSVQRVAVVRPLVGMVSSSPAGNVELPAETLESTTAELATLVERGLERRGLTVVNASDGTRETTTGSAGPELIARYLELSARIMPKTRDTSAAERLIEKGRYGPPTQRPVDLDGRVGLGSEAVAFAREHDADALMFVEFDAVYETLAEYRSATIWGAMLPGSTVDFAERYLPPDRYAIRIALIDGKTGAAFWAYRLTHGKFTREVSVATVVGRMLNSLPTR